MSSSYYQPEDLPRFSEVGKYREDLWSKFLEWYSAASGEGGLLSKREKALVGLGVAHAIQCPYCIDAYTQAGLEAGLSMEHMTEAIHLAAAVRGGASLIHGLQSQRAAEKLEM